MSKRLEESEQLRAEYPTYVPVTLKPHKRSQLPPAKYRLMLPRHCKIELVSQKLKERLRHNGVALAGKSIFLFNVKDDNVVCNAGQTLESIITKPDALTDGWLDLIYHDHETF